MLNGKPSIELGRNALALTKCCVILVWTMIQMDSVRSVLHKHIDKPLFQHVSTPQSQTPSSTEVRSTLHMFLICTYTL